MKTRQGTSTPKFSRKNSQTSPQLSRTSQLHSDIIPDVVPSIYAKSIHHKITISNNYQKQNSMHKYDGNQQDRLRSTGNFKIKAKQDVQNQSIRIQQGVKVLYETQPKQSNIKVSYIPIESISTSQSLPTARKRITYSALQTKRNQSTSSKTSKKLDNTYIYAYQNQSSGLAETQTQTSRQKQEINKLLQEINNLKTSNLNLQYEVNKYKQIVWGFQKQLVSKKQEVQKLKKIILQNEGKMQQYKNIEENIRKLQIDMKIKNQQNKELIKSIQIKDKLLENLQKQQNSNKFQSRCNQKHAARSVSISQSIHTYTHTSTYNHNNRISTFKPTTSNQQKCNRYVQTQNSKIEIVLKQNQILNINLKNKQKMIKMLQKDIKILNQKAKQLQKINIKLAQQQKLIQNLNQKLMGQTAAKLANKYRYF